MLASSASLLALASNTTRARMQMRRCIKSVPYVSFKESIVAHTATTILAQ